VLAQVPGPHDRAALAGATSKLEAAAGEALSAADGVTVAVSTARDPEVSAAVTGALAGGRALHLTYVGALDERTERVVDPMRVLTLEGRTYLEAWCRRAEAVRTFRLDRIEAAVVLDEPAVVPEDAAPVDLGAGALRPEGAPVTLALEPEVAWIAEEHPVESVTDLGDGRLEVVMPVADERWLERLLLRLGPSVTVLDRPDLAERVAHLILMTADHHAGVADPDEALFLDMDFAILGAPPAHYVCYAAAIRREFSAAPAEAYRNGRGAFLTGVLAQKRMFRTDLYEDERGDQARANLAWEIGELAAGRIPGA